LEVSPCPGLEDASGCVAMATAGCNTDGDSAGVPCRETEPQNRASSSRVSVSDVGDASAAAIDPDLEKKRAFEAKRKQHYNERDMLRRAMMAKRRVDDDDDDDEDDDVAADANKDPNRKPRNGGWARGPDAIHGGPKLAADQSRPARTRGAVGGDEHRLLDGDSRLREPAEANRMTEEKKRVVWDEATIAEHDLERGTRQKIEEPNTPWMGSPQISNEGTPGPSGTPAEPEEGSASKSTTKACVRIVEEDVHEMLHAWYRQEGHRVSIQQRWSKGSGSDAEGGAASKDGGADAGEDSKEEQAKKDAFAAKRKQHYNEMDLVRKMMAAKAAEEDDEDDDESNEGAGEDDGNTKDS